MDLYSFQAHRATGIGNIFSGRLSKSEQNIREHVMIFYVHCTQHNNNKNENSNDDDGNSVNVVINKSHRTSNLRVQI